MAVPAPDNSNIFERKNGKIHRCLHFINLIRRFMTVEKESRMIFPIIRRN